MSETRTVPPAPPDSDDGSQQRPRSRRRYLRHLLWGSTGVGLLLIAGVVGLYFWASSSAFENIIRKRLIARIDAATGGRAEIASFHWNLLNLEGEADGLVLHGREAAGEAPYAQLASLRISISVLGLFSPRVSVARLGTDRAANSPHRLSRRLNEPAAAAQEDRDTSAGHTLRPPGQPRRG